MKKKYEEWIKKNVDHSAPGFCQEVALCMSQTFPELYPVRGLYEEGGNRYEHAWCVDPVDGSVVDPTLFQFEIKNGRHFGECPLIVVSEHEFEVAIHKASLDCEAVSFGGFEDCNTLLALRVLQYLEDQAEKYSEEELKEFT